MDKEKEYYKKIALEVSKKKAEAKLLELQTKLEILNEIKNIDLKRASKRKPKAKENDVLADIEKIANANIKEQINHEEKEEKEWDVPIGTPINYFDPTLSYELTGYRPITKTLGLDFDPTLFLKVGQTYEETGKYTSYLPGTVLYKKFWDRERSRCKFGLTIGKYTITGDNYYWLNYYRLLNIKNAGVAAGRTESFPIFLNKQYEYFHYIQLCRMLNKDFCALKSRGVGASEIACSLGANLYTTTPNSRTVYTCKTEVLLLPTLEKVWQQLDFLNKETLGGFKHLRMKKDTDMQKKASKVDKFGNESGHMAILEGIVADKPRKLRGRRCEQVMFEESGSFQDLIETYIQSEPLVSLLGNRIGIRYCFGCVCKGTKVLTINGDIINIEDIKEDDGIIGFDVNSYKGSKENITYILEKAFKRCVKITLEDGTFLECSEDHPIYIVVQNKITNKRVGKFVPAKDIDIVNDYALCYSGNEKFGKSFLDLEKLKDMYYGVLPKNFNDLSEEDTWMLLHLVLMNLVRYNSFLNEVRLVHSNITFLKQISSLLAKFNIESVRKDNVLIFKDLDAYVLKNYITDVKECGHSLAMIHELLDKRRSSIKKVISIQPIGVKRIYNLTANNTHTYVANGIVTHNTGGEKGPGLAGLAKIFNNPEVYNVLPYKNNYTNDGSVAFTGFFIPAYTMWFGTKDVPGYDERGVVDEEAAKDYYEKERSRMADNPDSLIKYKAEYCFTPEEALILEGENRFNQERLVELLANIEIHKTVELPKKVILHWGFKDGQIDRNTIPTIEYTPQGKIDLLEEPIRDLGGIPMTNLYVVGIDSIDTDESTTTGQTDLSNFCAIVYRRSFGVHPPKVVAVYKDRPRDVRLAYDNALKLCLFYNAKALLEATRVSLKLYWQLFDKLNYLMKRPKSTITNLKANVRLIGAPATLPIIEHLLDLISDYVNDYCDCINFPELINELLRYSIANKRKFDMVAALGMAMLADEDLIGKLPKAIENTECKEINEIGYYKNEYGQTVFGIKPKKKVEDYGWLSYGRSNSRSY